MSPSFLTRYRHFLATALRDKAGVSFKSQPLLYLLRILTLALRGFVAHHGQLRASALTFYSLLSLVPVMAMAFGVAKGFGFERLLEKELLEHFSAQHEVITQVIAFARNMLDNTKGGLVAGVGVVVLFWSVIKVLDNIEDSFNHIWEATARTWLRKLTDYLSMILIAPLVLILSGSTTVYVAAQVATLSSQVGLENIMTPALALGLSLAPYMLAWFLFTLVYLIMPNTKVRLSSALPAGICAGSAFQALQIGYIKFQILMTSYNAIYGSFAALPLFFIWLNLSWHIVLLGAEIAHAIQSGPELKLADKDMAPSPYQIKLLALGLVAHVARIFHRGEAPRTARQLADDLDYPPGLTRHLVKTLVQARILSQLAGADTHGASPVQPARDISTLSVVQVLSALDKTGQNLDLDANESLHTVNDLLQRLERDLQTSSANLLVTQIPFHN